MEFTLDPVNYTELARQGIVNKGDIHTRVLLAALSG